MLQKTSLNHSWPSGLENAQTRAWSSWLNHTPPCSKRICALLSCPTHWQIKCIQQKGLQPPELILVGGTFCKGQMGQQDNVLSSCSQGTRSHYKAERTSKVVDTSLGMVHVKTNRIASLHLSNYRWFKRTQRATERKELWSPTAFVSNQWGRTGGKSF